MKIAIYYPWIHLKSGAERTILETLKRSGHEYTIYTNHLDRKGTFAEFNKFKIVELKRIPVRRNIISVIKAATTIIFQKIDLTEHDLLLVHSEGLGDFILFRNSKIPVVCFCHTPLRPVFDPDYRIRARNKRAFAGRVIYKLLESIFRTMDVYLWRKYKHIIFNSKESAMRAKAGGLISDNSKYKILHPGVDWENITLGRKYDNYFLLPGRIMWTKNIELAIEAFLTFEKGRAGNRNFKLVIAGQVDKKSGRYYKMLKSLAKNSSNIRFIKNPTDKKMGSLYSNCYLTLATAFNEDWGLTPIEGNAYGKPAICVNKGGYRESQINENTGYLTKNDPREIAEKMTLLANNVKLTKQMGKNARDISEIYSWKNFVKSLDQSLIVFSD